MNFLKRTFFLISILTTYLAAQTYEFPVSSGTMVEAYSDIFNGISAMLSNQSYLESIHLVFLLGAFYVFAASILTSKSEKITQDDRGNGVVSSFAKYLIAGTFILIIAFARTSDSKLLITNTGDLQAGSYCSIQSVNDELVGLPDVLSFVFASTRSTGFEIENILQTAFTSISPTNEILASFKNSSNTGSGSIPSRIANMTTFTWKDVKPEILEQELLVDPKFGKITFADALFNYTPKFYEQCIFSSGLRDFVYLSNVLGAFKQTENINLTLNDMSTNNIINIYSSKQKGDIKYTGGSTSVEYPYVYSVGNIPSDQQFQKKVFIYNNNDGTKTITDCDYVYQQIVKKSLESWSIDDLICSNGVSRDNFTPASIFIATNDSIYTTISGAKSIAIQIAALNSLNTVANSSALLGQMQYTATKTIVEESLKNYGQGMYMAKMLPYLQMSIRAILYAFFPFVFLVILLPGGFAVAANYLKTMLWIELWSPAAAILTYFLSYANISTMGRVASNGGFSMESISSYTSEGIMIAAAAGYLYASIPALVLMIITGSSKMMRGLLAGMASSYAKNFDSQSILDDIQNTRRYQSSGSKLTQGEFNARISQLEGIKSGSHINAVGMNSNTWSNIGTGEALSDLEKAGKGAAAIEQGLDNVKNALNNKGTQDIAELQGQFDTHQNYKNIGASLGKMKLGEDLGTTGFMNSKGIDTNTVANDMTASQMESIQEMQTKYSASGDSLEKQAKNFGKIAGTQHMIDEAKEQYIHRAMGLNYNPQNMKQFKSAIEDKVHDKVINTREEMIHGKKVMFAETASGKIFRASPNSAWLRFTEGKSMDQIINEEKNSNLPGILKNMYTIAVGDNNLNKFTHAAAMKELVDIENYGSLTKSEAELIGQSQASKNIELVKSQEEIMKNSQEIKEIVKERTGLELQGEGSDFYINVKSATQAEQVLNDIANTKLQAETNKKANYTVKDEADLKSLKTNEELNKIAEIQKTTSMTNLGAMQGTVESFNTLKDSGIVQTIQNSGTTVEDIVKADSFKQLTEMNKNDFILAALGGDLAIASTEYGAYLAYKEFSSLIPNLDMDYTKFKDSSKTKKMRDTAKALEKTQKEKLKLEQKYKKNLSKSELKNIKKAEKELIKVFTKVNKSGDFIKTFENNIKKGGISLEKFVENINSKLGLGSEKEINKIKDAIKGFKNGTFTKEMANEIIQNNMNSLAKDVHNLRFDMSALEKDVKYKNISKSVEKLTSKLGKDLEETMGRSLTSAEKIKWASRLSSYKFSAARMGTSLAKGALIGLAIDFTSQAVMNNTRSGTLANSAAASVSTVSNIVESGVNAAIGTIANNKHKQEIAAKGFEASIKHLGDISSNTLSSKLEKEKVHFDNFIPSPFEVASVVFNEVKSLFKEDSATDTLSYAANNIKHLNKEYDLNLKNAMIIQKSDNEKTLFILHDEDTDTNIALAVKDRYGHVNPAIGLDNMNVNFIQNGTEIQNLSHNEELGRDFSYTLEVQEAIKEYEDTIKNHISNDRYKEFANKRLERKLSNIYNKFYLNNTISF